MMNETRKFSRGIPELPTSTPFFKCPFCEKAKMMKRSGNKSKDEDVFIPGQAYHMDLAFVSGPSNLEDIRTSSDKPNLTVKQSRDGYIGFLTIIDVASRQLWTHLIRIEILQHNISVNFSDDTVSDKQIHQKQSLQQVTKDTLQSQKRSKQL